ncbi:MAG: orotate phosphoribosyltransferase [Bacteroidales bacterium]
MTRQQDISRTIAGYLLDIEAVKLNVAEPFTWASGMKSPIYCDNRQILSYPKIRQQVAQHMSQLVREHFVGAEVIAGVATGAIAIGVLVAQELGLPFIYVRSTAKEHGLGNQVEGRVEAGKKTVVVEDLVSTGKSSLAAVEALRQAGLQVAGMAAIFTYQLPAAAKVMDDHQCPLFTLSNYTSLVELALENGTISESDMGVLKKWREDPRQWAARL